MDSVEDNVFLGDLSSVFRKLIPYSCVWTCSSFPVSTHRFHQDEAVKSGCSSQQCVYGGQRERNSEEQDI